MTAEFEDLTLRMLREIRDDLKAVKEDVAGVNRRLTSVERSIGELKVDVAETHHRLDLFGQRVDRIERRLELNDNFLMEKSESFKGPKDV